MTDENHERRIAALEFGKNSTNGRFGPIEARLRALETQQKEMIPEIIASLHANTDMLGRVEALEKNCPEPQEIEPRVIRALLKLGVIKCEILDVPTNGSPEYWYVNHGEIDDDVWPLLRAQVGVADDAASPPAKARDENPDTATGDDLDFLARYYGVRPRERSPLGWEADDSLRIRIKGQIASLDAGVADREPVQVKRETVPAFKTGDLVLVMGDVPSSYFPGRTIPRGAVGVIVQASDQQPALWEVYLKPFGTFYIDEKNLRHRKPTREEIKSDNLTDADLEIPEFLKPFIDGTTMADMMLREKVRCNGRTRLAVRGIAEILRRHLDGQPVDIRHLCQPFEDRHEADEAIPDEVDADLPDDEEAVSFLAECGMGIVGTSRQAGDMVRAIVERWSK